jgi:hypothetical protein
MTKLDYTFKNDTLCKMLFVKLILTLENMVMSIYDNK